MTGRPTFEDIFAVLSAASTGEVAARVRLPDEPALDDGATRLASALNVLLDDLALRTAEIKRVESELRRALEARDRLALIVESSEDAIVVSSLDGVITGWNPGAERLYGWSASEVVGRAFQEHIPLECVDEVEQQLRRALEGTPTFEETVRLRRDGSRVDVAVSRSPLRDATGTVVGVVVITRDLSARRASEARVQAMVDASLDAVVGMDLNGNVVEWSHHAELIFGRSRAEALGRPLADLIIPERYREAHYRGLAHCRRTGEGPLLGRRLELEAVDKSGRELPIELSITPVDTPHGPIFSAFLRDLTERNAAVRQREELEGRLRQAERLDGLGRLAGGVAHDLNNVLAITSNYADFLTERLPADDPGQADLREIKAAAQRGTTFTRQLLTFARRGGAEAVDLDLGELLAGLRSMLGPALPATVALDLRPASELWHVRADRGQIEQVILDLVINARDAMPHGGRLLIEAINAEYDEAAAGQHGDLAPGRYVMLSVTDTGAGMPKEVLARAFEPFFTTKPAGEGTGLGLATVYGAIQQAGGRVWLYSEVGRGTTARVLLPAAAAVAAVVAENPRAASDEASPPRPGTVVLLVEDESAVREAARRILGASGYDVLDAESGAEALTVSARCQRPIALLLSDMVMPGISGPELARRLRASRPDLRVVYMSGYSDDVVAANEPLDAPLLRKPFTRGPLLTIVARALGGPEGLTG